MADFYDIYDKYNQWNELSDRAKEALGNFGPGIGIASSFLPKDYSKYEPLFTEYGKLLDGSSTDYLGFQNLANQYGLGGAEFEKWLDNMISRQNQQEAWNQDEYMRDTSLLSSGDQLAQLGLSSAGVLQTGGAVTPNLGAAQNVKENVALQKLHERNMMAQSVLKTMSMLGSAGIHGLTMSRVRRAASGLANYTANSAFRFM